MVIKLKNIYTEDLNSFENDILLNKSVTNFSPSNMYEILFDCQNFDNILNLFLSTIKEQTKEDFEVYVKNMWGYVQTDPEDEKINFNINLKDDLSIRPNYSFIYLIKSGQIKIHIKDGDMINEYDLERGDLIIFKTENFIKDEFINGERIALIGSLLNNLSYDNKEKKLI